MQRGGASCQGRLVAGSQWGKQRKAVEEDTDGRDNPLRKTGCEDPVRKAAQGS